MFDSQADSRAITDILGQVTDPAQAAEQLLPLVYRQLRAAAEQQMASERTGHTLQPTALVHEAFLKLVGDRATPWQSRRHFYSAAADAMRKILIDHARTRDRVKRGGGRARVELESVSHLLEADTTEILNFDEVFRRFEAEAPEPAAVARLRFWAGLSVDETAEALGISARSVDRRWSYARMWLFRELSRIEEAGADEP